MSVGAGVLSLSERPDQLVFDGERFPAIIVGDVARDALQGWISSRKRAIEALLARTGAILFRGFPVDSAESFDAFSSAFGYRDFTYRDSLSNAVRIDHTERVFTANEAPREIEIFLHHELAQTPVYPARIFFFCQQAAEKGGATPLCRSDKLFERLRAESPAWAERFETAGVRYTSIMPPENDPASGQGRSWKSTLGVTAPREAERKLTSLRYTWQWLDTGALVAVTPALPAVIRLADGSKSFFNQLVAAYLGWKGVRENPTAALSMGDGTPIPADILELVSRLATEFTFDLHWQDGDVAMVDNLRTMHGRRPYAGAKPRQVLVSMALGT